MEFSQLAIFFPVNLFAHQSNLPSLTAYLEFYFCFQSIFGIGGGGGTGGGGGGIMESANFTESLLLAAGFSVLFAGQPNESVAIASIRMKFIRFIL